MFEKLRIPLKPISEFIASFFAWVHPNVITIGGFLLGFIPVYFFIKGNTTLAAVGMIFYISDFLDGAVARLTGRVSLFGEVLDATLDRITDGFLIFSIAQGGFISWTLAFITLLGFYLVSYTRARVGEASAKRVKLNVGIAQRGDRILLILLASIFYFDKIYIPILDLSVNSFEIVFVILLILTWLTAIWRMIVAYKELNIKHNNEKSI